MQFLLLVCACLLSACRTSARGPEFENAAEPSVRTATTRAGRFQIMWHPVPALILVNEPFELEVLVVRPENGRPVEGATINVSGWMPEHGQGMARLTRSEEIKPGVYRVRGMLLHMTGSWELAIDVIHESVAESALFELELE